MMDEVATAVMNISFVANWIGAVYPVMPGVFKDLGAN
jgi:hypothetical protein